MKKLLVFDTTLRVMCEELKKDISFREKLSIASLLEKAGVSGIELPALLGGKEDSVINRTVASNLESSTVSISAGDSAESLNEAYDSVKEAKSSCIQVILPVSTVQMEYMYHLKTTKMLDKIADMCKQASAVCDNVEFVAKDASRAEDGFAAMCCKTAAENGAKAVTLCDDAGVYFPEEFAALVKEVKSVCSAAVYVQPSNALNLAAACAVEVIKAGADGIKTAAYKDYLSSDALADIIRARGETLGVTTDLDITAIHNIVSSIGADNTAAQTTDVIKENDTVTLDKNCTLSDIITAVGSLGYELSDQDGGKVYEEFRRVISKKDVIGARELEAIIATSAMQVPSTFHVSSYVVNSGNIITATANVTLEKDGELLSGVSTGDGPIDAAFHAIEQIVGHRYELDDFQIQAVTKGREAVGSSLIRLRADGKLYSGNGISTDIVGACIRAYINALNKIVYEGN